MEGISMKNFIIILLLFIAMTLLQIFLSKRKDKFIGLVLPILIFIRSLYTVFSLWIRNVIGREIFVYFLFVNIPTIVFVMVYLISRKKIKINREIEKNEYSGFRIIKKELRWAKDGNHIVIILLTHH